MGTYYLAFNFILSLAAFCCLGFNTGLLRFVAVLQAEGQAAEIKKIFWPAMGLATLFSCLAAAALYGLRGWLAEYFHSLHLPARPKIHGLRPARVCGRYPVHGNRARPGRRPAGGNPTEYSLKCTNHGF